MGYNLNQKCCIQDKPYNLNGHENWNFTFRFNSPKLDQMWMKLTQQSSSDDKDDPGIMILEIPSIKRVYVWKCVCQRRSA